MRFTSDGRRWVLFGAIAALTVACAGCASMGPLSPLHPLERKAVFHPARYPAGNWQPQIPQLEDAWFTAADGTKLHGWFLPHNNPRAIALVCHGNAGNITSLAETLAIMNRFHGVSVMAFDYRGFGRSEGAPSETGILLDARAARAWLARRCGIDEAEIVVMGRSLGGGVAVDLAAKDGARGLVLASTFTSLPDVAAHHFKWLPAKLLMTMRMNSLESIQHYRGPVLISHGDADEVIPYRQGLALFEAVPGRKRFITIPGGKHDDPQNEEYRAAFDEFLNSLPPPGATAAARPKLADVDVTVQDLGIP